MILLEFHNTCFLDRETSGDEGRDEIINLRRRGLAFLAIAKGDYSNIQPSVYKTHTPDMIEA